MKKENQTLGDLTELSYEIGSPENKKAQKKTCVTVALFFLATPWINVDWNLVK